MKSFIQKKEELTKLKDKLEKAKIAIFTSFAREGEKGLNVAEMRELKKGLKSTDAEYLVEKKTILDKALLEGTRDKAQGTRVNIFEYQGSLGVALGYGDEQSAAKSIYGFARKHPALKYFGAIQAGKFMDLVQFTEFAKLPTKDVMIARLLGMMKYPISALTMVLKQISEKAESKV